MTNRAALYLRSSKDRSDVSIDAQRRALQELAQNKSLVVVREFIDAVESGKDEDRPGFQSLLRALKDPARDWENVLVLDTSRVARRRHIALIFEHEAKRAGVRIYFRNVPDTDPITEMLLKSILQAMDEWHSLTSRAKGLAGMAENVRQGWRAGGKAPRGYSLEYHPTGAIRDGSPVLKSKLKPNDDAPIVAAYLKGRASGIPRGRLISELRIEWQSASLNDLEWMALTYAGHTAWNTTNERTPDGYIGDVKRKPRDQWLVTRDTHPALISDDQAEAILLALEKRRNVRTRDTDRPFLLTGMLFSPDGLPWIGDWDNKMNAALYRLGKGRRVSARRVDSTVLNQVLSDLSSDESIEIILQSMKELGEDPVDDKKINGLTSRIESITSKVARLVDLITEADETERAAYRRAISTSESERLGLIDELTKMRRRAASQKAGTSVTPADARRFMKVLFDDFQSAVNSDDIRATKSALGGLIQKITLDEAVEHCHIQYRIDASTAPSDTGVIVATLRGFEPRYSP